MLERISLCLEPGRRSFLKNAKSGASRNCLLLLACLTPSQNRRPSWLVQERYIAGRARDCQNMSKTPANDIREPLADAPFLDFLYPDGAYPLIDKRYIH